MLAHGLAAELSERQQDGQIRCTVAGHARHVHVVGWGKRAGLDEAFQCDLRQGKLRAGVVWRCEMEVAPIDAQIVARTIQNALILRANIQDGEPLSAGTAPGNRFIGSIDRDDRIHIDEDGKIVVTLARCAHSEVSDRAGENIEILREGWREKGDGEADLASFELINGVRGCDLERGLRHRGHFTRISAHKAPRFAVDPGKAIEGLVAAGPVLRVLVSEFVGHGPDAEIGVVRDERDGGWPLLRNSHRNGDCGKRGQQATHEPALCKRFHSCTRFPCSGKQTTA